MGKERIVYNRHTMTDEIKIEEVMAELEDRLVPE